MFHSSAQAPCRLTARRRLALGGFVMTGALAAGAFVSTPAFADPSVTEVGTVADLDAALAGPASNIRLTAPIDATDDGASFDPATITSTKTLDLNGFELDIDQISVAHDVSFTVDDATADDGAPGDGRLVVTARQDPSSSSTQTISGIDLGSSATFHATGARVTASGTDGGPGIGSGEDDVTASFIADSGARVVASGSDQTTPFGEVGAAGIGGSLGNSGIRVTVEGGAYVSAAGGTGAAGVGGGAFGGGGAVRLGADSTLLAYQGGQFSAFGSPDQLEASSIGAGQGADLAFGTLQLDRDADLDVNAQSRLVLPASSTPAVENAGEIDIDSSDRSSVQGTGTIHNLGTIRAHDYDADTHYRTVDPTVAVNDVKVTGNNYAVTIDANGGSYQGVSTGHVMSASLRSLVGSAYEDYTLTEPAGYTFSRWNTAANGSGVDIVDDLTAAGPSDGTPKPVTLFAKYARVPYATATTLPDATVGTPYRAQLPVAGDGLTSYSVSYGNSSSNVIPGLPAGLSIDPATGLITGTPTEAANRDVTFYVQGVGGADLTYRLVVKAAPVVEGPKAPVIGSIARQTVKLGQALSVSVAASSTLSVSYAVTSGSLPKGIALNAGSGAITGVPTAPGVYSALITATSAGGSSSTTVVIVVPEVKDLLHTKNDVPAVKVGAAKVPLKVAGFKKGEHWTVKVDGKVVHRGTMKKAGTLSVSVHLKKALRDKVHTIAIAGSRRITDKSTRAATVVTVTSLTAKKTLKAKSVAGQDGRKYVVIARLAAGERVVVKDGAKVIASGHAYEDGSFVFPQSKAGKGTSRLTVHGATAKRAGRLTVKNAKP